jgi:hypothetical protein
MLLRLLLALTIALLPMPAAAACHAQPAPTAHHHGMKHAPVKQAPAEQLCIGCVAPATARAPEFAAPLAFARTPASPAYLPGAPRIAAPPATPPPRSAA